jgi:hypothetical protein
MNRHLWLNTSNAAIIRSKWRNLTQMMRYATESSIINCCMYRVVIFNCYVCSIVFRMESLLKLWRVWATFIGPHSHINIFKSWFSIVISCILNALHIIVGWCHLAIGFLFILTSALLRFNLSICSNRTWSSSNFDNKILTCVTT